MKYFKNSIVVLTVLFFGSALIFSACQKNDDFTSAPGTQTEQVLPSGGNDNSLAPSFSFTAADGHVIGVNGDRSQYSTMRTGDGSIMGCGATTAPQLTLASGLNLTLNHYGSVLSASWQGGGGEYIAMYINGAPYINSAGYGLWMSYYWSVMAECFCIPGGIVPGKQYDVFIRTYCNPDTTGAIANGAYYDSPLSSITVPSNFDPTCKLNTTTKTKGGGGGKGGGKKNG